MASLKKKKWKISQLKLRSNVTLLGICTTAAAAGANFQCSQCMGIMNTVTGQWPTQPPTHGWSFQKSSTGVSRETNYPPQGMAKLDPHFHYSLLPCWSKRNICEKDNEGIKWWHLPIWWNLILLPLPLWFWRGLLFHLLPIKQKLNGFSVARKLSPTERRHILGAHQGVTW